TDTVLTLDVTNLVGVSGTIQVIADDGAGGRATNSFTVTTITDSNNAPPMIYPATVTNRVGAVNTRLTNIVSVHDLEGNPFYWAAFYLDQNSFQNGSNSFFNVITNGKLEAVIVPN